MKFKNYFLNVVISTLFFVNFGLFGQETGELDDCMKRFSTYYHQSYKTKKYAEAYPSWKISFYECLDKYTDDNHKKTITSHGRRILTARITDAKTEQEKKDRTDELIKYYDIVIEKFPDQKHEYLGYKGVDMFKLQLNMDSSYVLLKTSVETNKDPDITTIDAYFKNSVYLYNAKKISDTEVFSDFDIIMEKIDEISIDINKEINEIRGEDSTKVLSKNEEKKIKILESKKEALTKLGSNSDKLISPIATKERIVILYSQKFDENKNNEKWLVSALSMLGRKKCFDEEIYRNIAVEYHKISPTYKSANALGIMYLMEKDYTNSFNYYQEALNLADTDDRKAESYVNMAKSLISINSRRPEAKSYAQKSLGINNKIGSAYLVIGTLYAESANECGNNIFEKKAVYWAAVDKFKKAKLFAETDAIKEQSQKLINNYSQQAPDKELIFQYGYIDKPTYTIKCWINETVNIPKQ